ncbi:unnamed protein product [Orchesella dallaii]|uniref:C-type lectin domain-containing protein n=1 Tax=Orchesella dallaii TaxID=48710 RepID=A0ABP1PIR2_9HEXA
MKILLLSFLLGASLAAPATHPELGINVLGTVNGKTFITTYSNTPLSWNEAYNYCQRNDWSMAEISSNEEAELLKSVYDPVNFNGWYWVGAQLDETTDDFIWPHSGEVVQTFESLHTSTWTNAENPQNCLCYSSNNHEIGYYFRRACHNKHLILCESLHPVAQSVVIPKRKQELVKIGSFQGTSYFSDNAIRNWTESEAFCSGHGLKLATVTPNPGLIEFLKEACKNINYDGWFWVEKLATDRHNQVYSDNCHTFDAQDGSRFPRKCFHRHFTLCESLSDSQERHNESTEDYLKLNAHPSFQIGSDFYNSLTDKQKMELAQADATPKPNATLIKKGKFRGISYFGDRVARNWDDSMSFCETHGLQLALGNAFEYRTNPDLVDFLRNARFSNWSWVYPTGVNGIFRKIEGNKCPALGPIGLRYKQRDCRWGLLSLCQTKGLAEIKFYSEDSEEKY